MAEKVTVMALKVDLQCTKCYNKVKKLLCKYPQIRDQVYDEKANTVIITVVCCSPEKIRDKLCRKGGGTIKSIDIKEPVKAKPAEPEKSKPNPPADPEKSKSKPPADPEKSKPKPPADPKPVEKTQQVVIVEPSKPAAPVQAVPVPIAYPLAQAPVYPPYGVCYVPCNGMGMPGPTPCNCGCMLRSVSYDNYGNPTSYYVNNRGDYFSEENPSACTVM